MQQQQRLIFSCRDHQNLHTISLRGLLQSSIPSIYLNNIKMYQVIGISICCLSSIGILAYKILLLTNTENATEQIFHVMGLIFFTVLLAGCITSDLPLPTKPKTKLGSPEYDLQTILAPRIDGMLLRVVSFVICHRLVGHLIRKVLINMNGPDELRDLAEQATRKMYPIVYYPICRTCPEQVTDEMAQTATDAIRKEGISITYDNQRIVGIMDYYNAYKGNKITPSQMMFRVFEAMDQLKILNMFGDNIFVDFNRNLVMEQARESDKRWEANKPLSVFDGVPVAIKGKLSEKIQQSREMAGQPLPPIRLNISNLSCYLLFLRCH